MGDEGSMTWRQFGSVLTVLVVVFGGAGGMLMQYTSTQSMQDARIEANTTAIRTDRQRNSDEHGAVMAHNTALAAAVTSLTTAVTELKTEVRFLRTGVGPRSER